jgi:hypothetical protein
MLPPSLSDETQKAQPVAARGTELVTSSCGSTYGLESSHVFVANSSPRGKSEVRGVKRAEIHVTEVAQR